MYRFNALKMAVCLPDLYRWMRRFNAFLLIYEYGIVAALWWKIDPLKRRIGKLFSDYGFTALRAAQRRFIKPLNISKYINDKKT